MWDARLTQQIWMCFYKLKLTKEQCGCKYKRWGLYDEWHADQPVVG